MNWLAHLRLAPDHSLVRVGNLAGDFVRGVDTNELHPDVQTGIAQHRAIDKFVDAHEVCRRGRARFPEPVRRYGGVALDVFFDHFLARDWHRYGNGMSLDAFADTVHAELDQHRDLLPKDLALVQRRIAQHRWLTMYGTVDGIERVLQAMARRSRARRPSPLATITDELRKNYGDLERDFAGLWPELMQFAVRQHGR